MKPKVIVNPAAKQGGSGKNWPEVEARLKAAIGDFDASFTSAPGDAKEIARAACAEGYDHFIAVGGDGTANEMLNGLMENGALLNPEAVLCPIPAGTANELCRALDMLDDPAAPYRAIAEGNKRRIDLCRMDCTGLDGAPHRHYAYLIASFGSAAEISYRTSTSRIIKKLGGEFSYFLVTLLVTLTYKHRPTRVVIDGDFDREMPVFSGLCCNAPNGGGGMMLAPDASLDDGLLDLVIFGDMKRRDFLLQPPSWLFEGRHVEHPKVQVVRGKKFTFTGDTGMLVDADGETVGRLPLSVEVLPGALNVKH